MPIGRLDMNSEGLLLLTNDGGLKRQLELPTTGWQRRYRVRVHGDVDEAKLASLAAGITIDGFDYGPIEAVLERTLGKNAWLNVALREGKNREIRKVMEHFGWPVNRLIRVSFGPFHLGNLEKSAIDEIKTKVVKEQVGLVLRSTTSQSQRKRRLGAKPSKAKAPAQRSRKPLSKGEVAKSEPATKRGATAAGQEKLKLKTGAPRSGGKTDTRKPVSPSARQRRPGPNSSPRSRSASPTRDRRKNR